MIALGSLQGGGEGLEGGGGGVGGLNICVRGTHTRVKSLEENGVTDYLGQYLSYYIQTWHEGRRMDAMLYAHARFHDLGLDARSQWVGKGKTIGVACSLQLNKQY